MMKNFVTVLVVGCAVAVSAFDPMSYPKPRCADRFDFEKKLNMSAWPRSAKNDLSRVDGFSGKAMRILPSANSMTAYGNISLTAPAPGTMSVSFDYKYENPAGTRLDVALNCKQKNNRLTGKCHSGVQPSGKWSKFHKVFTIPEETTAIQYVFRVTGKSGVLLDNITVCYTPDTVTVPLVKKVDFNASPGAWTWNPRDLQYGFYSHGKDAAVPAVIQTAADVNGLAIMIRNFTAPAKLKTDITARDGALWLNDANELFLFDEKRSIGWQFIIGANGTVMDGKLVQRVPGDPWKSDKSWNGNWKHAAKITEDGFETRFYIPWKTLGLDVKKGFSLRFNAAGDYTAANDYPGWNNYTGTRLDIGQYGSLQLNNNKLTLKRHRNTRKMSFAIKRAQPQFASLLNKNEKGNYQVDVWAAGLARQDFAPAVMNRVSDAEFSAWQDELLRSWLAAGIGGPAWPWVFTYGRERMKKMYQKGMRYPFMVSNSDLGREARKNGAKFINPANDWICDVNENSFLQAVENFIERRKNQNDYAFVKASTKFGMGIDEPTNPVEIVYNPQLNHANKDAIFSHSEMIKEKFGFGKYGSPFLPDIAETDKPFARIAFYRWWNGELKKSLDRIQKSFKSAFPGVPFMLLDDNNTAGQSNLDAANLNKLAELVSCDPYPTAANAFYGMSRALYHVGFSCRVLRDLVPSAKLMIMPQCFIYHGNYGDKYAMLEWASQALKNGAVHFMWYCSKAPGNMFKDYAAMLEISAMIKQLNRVMLPEKTQTLVWYSNFDKWAKSDYAQHAAYSLYTLLYEKLGSNFRFVSDTSLENGDIDLKNYKLMYVPQMSYTTESIARKLTQWVRNGGTLVVFDPLFMSFNTDGTANSFRRELTGQTGTTLPVKKSANSQIKWQQKTLPAAVIANAPALPGSQFQSYTINASGSKSIAFYGDNTPAAIERNIGKGKVIYFGIQPFAGPDIAVKDSAWNDFLAAQAKNINETVNLKIKDFQLPEPPVTVKLKQLIK